MAYVRDDKDVLRALIETLIQSTTPAGSADHRSVLDEV